MQAANLRLGVSSQTDQLIDRNRQLICSLPKTISITNPLQCEKL